MPGYCARGLQRLRVLSAREGVGTRSSQGVNSTAASAARAHPAARWARIPRVSATCRTWALRALLCECAARPHGHSQQGASAHAHWLLTPRYRCRWRTGGSCTRARCPAGRTAKRWRKVCSRSTRSESSVHVTSPAPCAAQPRLDAAEAALHRDIERTRHALHSPSCRCSPPAAPQARGTWGKASPAGAARSQRMPPRACCCHAAAPLCACRSCR